MARAPEGISILSPFGELYQGILACLGSEQVVVAPAVEVTIATMPSCLFHDTHSSATPGLHRS